jgi:heterodisulfide reductase subunit A
MAPRIGFYICHCGINIAHRVRVEEVAGYAAGLPGVVVARDYKFMCSDPGQALIEKDIPELNLNRVVVASCSPRLHGKTFMGACQRAGLNPYHFQMASVREQVSWVTVDAGEATDKAKSLVAAAIARVVRHHGLESRRAAVHPDVLVVGGGISGMQAALDIASSGQRAYLVERDTTIGGHMLQFDKTFPTLDCAACIGTPKMVEVAQNPNIEVLTCSEVTEVSGFIGNYSVTVQRRPRYVTEGICTGCGECAKLCPVSLPNGWDQGLGERRAIGRAFPQAIPITFNIEKYDRAPCVQRCPAGTNVQGYIQLIAQERYVEALQLILERLPLPGVLGRVCPRPCESQCRRAEVDEPLAIRDLKRFAADRVPLEQLPLPTIRERAERVAVVGSGPAGLTAAYYLRRKGFQITLFEAADVLGGMLRLGIPDYRLPPEVLDREIAHILRLGIEVRTGQRLGRDFTLEDLRRQGFGAIFLGIGAQQPLTLSIPGADEARGVFDALAFLRAAHLGRPLTAGSRVAVIGGGNVAIDAARVARRLGAAHVSIVYRRSRQEMPADPEEIQGAVEEGVSLQCLAAPTRVLTSEGRVQGLECLRTELGAPDASGRRRPIPVEGSQFTLPCDGVILAIGQQVEPMLRSQEPGLTWSRQGTLVVDAHSMQTALGNVFACGDAVSGPATVVEAVGAAHRAVEAIERLLDGRPVAGDECRSAATEGAGRGWLPLPAAVAPTTRARAEIIDVGERVNTFAEVDRNFSAAEAQREARRCLNCGGCCECMACVTACEAHAIDHGMRAEQRVVKVGSIILATGYDTLNPTGLKPYGYGAFPNVFTALEFERLSNATGPTGGRILTRNRQGRFDAPPASVAIVHCVGSRDVNHHAYCSRVCCMYALKYTHLIKEKVGHQVAVYDFYIDMRCFGKGYEEFFQRCQQEGTIFTRGRVAEISSRPGQGPDQAGQLVVHAEDTLLGTPLQVAVDMVILCTAMEARHDAPQVGRVFGVNVGADGFFLEEHPKLGPLNTATDGVFLAGCCQKPMDIPDTVAQASGAAAKALALATRGEVEIAPTTSWIDPEICVGCQICIGLCPYNAIEFDPRRGVSVVNEALCKGCGSCSGFCPSGAARSRHFTNLQIFAEIEGIIATKRSLGR